MAQINSEGYVVRTRKNVSNAPIGRKWWLIKPDKTIILKLRFPDECIGKKIKIKIEFMED